MAEFPGASSGQPDPPPSSRNGAALSSHDISDGLEVDSTQLEGFVLFDYEKQQDDELSLKVGDVITDIKQSEEDGWCEGVLNGRRGLFPDNFVQVSRAALSSRDIMEVDSTPLDLDDDHFDVYSELRIVAVKWRSIGFALRLKRDVLDSIQGGNSGSAACLSSTVREWLSRNYNVEKFGEPTWQQLVEAVGHPAGGANVALAREIARRHKTRGPQMLTVTQQASTSPQGVTETQMSQPPHPLTILNQTAPPSSLEPAVVQSVTSFSPHLSPQTLSGGVPTLRDLCLLPVPNWYLLGLQLGVSADELDVIERNYPRDNHMCKAKMFGAWIRMDTSASYRKLARALVTVGKRNIAEALCTARGVPLPVLDGVTVATVDPLPPTLTLPPDHPECVARYAQYLKDKYKRMPTLPDGDWPPSLGRQYTRLAMIEQERELPGAELVATMEKDYIHGNIDNIVKRKKAIELPEIFLPTKDGGQELKILMDGVPGVGKSTLSRKVSKDWASGELLQQYHLVILLPLRQARIRTATSVEDLIFVDNPNRKQQVVRHIQETSGEHVLLIVDGYDELSYEDRTQNSLFLDILQGNQFPKCSVLVTSRPYASDYLQQLQSINRHVEVLGFTEEQIEHSIIQNIPDKTKATELVEALKERQDVVSLCYIPLNCAIVLYVYKMAQWTLPHSLTKLYEIFILNSIKRHASTTGNDSITIGLHSLAEIPESFEKRLNAVSKLAYDGLVADKMVFNVNDIKTAFPDCSHIDISINLLSLLTVFKEFTSTGEELSYQFLHLTIQEFLAARWAASQLSDNELLKFFQDHLREERYRMVLLFLAGISQLNFHTVEDLFQEKLNFKHPHFRGFSNAKVVDYFLFLAHLIYESQNFSLFHNLARAIVKAELTASRYCIAPFDCLVLAHFLAWCDCSLKLLDLSICDLTNQSLEIMHRVNLEHHGTTQIEVVNLSYNPMVIKLSLLSKLPMFECTRVLKACDRRYPEGTSCATDLLCLLNMRHLTTLEISVKGACCSPLAIYLSLNTFRCQGGNIHSQNAVRIFRSLEQNTTLVELDLSRNSQLAEGDSEAVGCAIERMLNVNRTLKVLNLSRCNVTDPIVKRTITGLMKNSSLVTLNVSSPKLSGSCAVSLFQQMTTHPTVSITIGEVNVLGVGNVRMDRGTMWYDIGDLISENCVEFFRALNNSGLKVSEWNVKDLTDQTADHFAVGLAESQSVQALKLSHSFWDKNYISSAGAVSIFRSLEHNTSLEELDLSGNSKLAEGDSEAVGCAIERMLNVNKTLKVLNLSNCILDTTVIIHTAAGLAHNVSLAVLSIGADYWSRNSITSEGWVHLFKALCNNTSLKKLNISGNKLGVKGSESLAEMLSCNKLLTELNLYSCNIPEAGLTEILAKGLLHNTSLKKLNISRNKLGMEGSVALADTLSCNKSLTELNLQWSDIPEAGFREIARGLLHNTSLKKLDISRNKIGVKGSEALAEMLSCNKLLTELNLRSCNIPEAGLTEILGKGLLHNTSLKKLNISYNKLGMEGSVALADMLSCNKSLTELDVRLCDIPKAGLREIARGLLTNTSLQTIVIGFTQDKTFLEAEIERLKKSGNFKSQSLRKIEIKSSDGDGIL